MGEHQRFLNDRQNELNRLLAIPAQHSQAIELFYQHHASLHSAAIATLPAWSFEDEVLTNLTPEDCRRIPPNAEHSIAWNLWHLARIEDTAINILVAGGPQVLHAENWLQCLKIADRDTGNRTSPEEIARLSAEIDLDALRAYRLAVGRRTREIVARLQPADLKHRVDPARIQRVLDEGAVIPAAREITDYWSRRTLAGLLLMPATRHNIVHLNEISRLRPKR